MCDSYTLFAERVTDLVSKAQPRRDREKSNYCGWYSYVKNKRFSLYSLGVISKGRIRNEFIQYVSRQLSIDHNVVFGLSNLIFLSRLCLPFILLSGSKVP